MACDEVIHVHYNQNSN